MISEEPHKIPKGSYLYVVADYGDVVYSPYSFNEGLITQVYQKGAGVILGTGQSEEASRRPDYLNSWLTQ